MENLLLTVCPTYVGMNRDGRIRKAVGNRMPHVCGDEPQKKKRLTAPRSYAPRMWG